MFFKYTYMASFASNGFGPGSIFKASSGFRLTTKSLIDSCLLSLMKTVSSCEAFEG